MITDHFSAADQAFMRQALALAKEGALSGEVPVGAILTLDGSIVGRGWNQPILSHDPSAHAEIQALRNAGASLKNYRLPESTLYVTLEPCIMCIGAICHARVKRLVYAAKDPKRGALEGALELAELNFLNHRVNVQGGLMAEASSELLLCFFRARRRAQTRHESVS